MYRITRCSDGAVLYDVNDPGTCPMTEPRGTFEIGQAGSLQFSLVPAHPLYDGVEVMETYVSAYKDNAEIFYGRVIDINVEQTTGIKQVECAGALQFLEDGEISPIQAEEQSSSENSDGESSDQEKGVQMTAAAFFSRCISDFNADIGNDPRRKFYVGVVRQDKAGEIQTYNISSHTKAKSAIESNLISEYGGYLKVRRGDQNKLYIDWLGTYDEPNSSPIRLRENVISQENAISANGMFTVIRPIGKDNLGLTPGTMVVDQTLVNKYGRIIKTVTFSYADTQELLAFAAQNYINEIAKGTSNIGTVKLIDMHFLDHNIPTIHLGSTYTNIAGFEGQAMVVAGMELNFASPADDSITLKNRRELEANQKDGTSGRGPLSKKIQETEKGQKGFQNIWQHITETEDMLRLHANRIEINARNLIEQVSTFERYAEETTEQIETQNGNIQAIKGTGVYQSSDRITQIAGLFTSTYAQVPEASYVGRVPKTAGWFEFEDYYVTEADINSGVEIYASPELAAAGIPINTMDEAEMKRLIEGGGHVYHLIPTDDMTPQSGKSYYQKDLGLVNGTSFSVTEDGSKTNIGKRLGVAFEIIDETKEMSVNNQTQITSMQGSALWTQKEHIVGVCGKYRIEKGPDGKETLIIEKGGGIKVEENGTQFGLFTEDNLDAGVIVGWINDPENANIVDGTKVNINASQVRVGNTSNVAAWMTATGNDINDLRGLVADIATIGQLRALDAKIDNIDAEYIESAIADLSLLHTTGSASFGGSVRVGGGLYLGSDATDISKNLANAVIGVGLSLDGKTLTLTQANGTVTNFRKAATAELSGSWSGTTFTVTATPSDSARPNIVQGKVWDTIVPAYGTTEYDSEHKNLSSEMIVYAEEDGEAGSVILRKKVIISADSAWQSGYTDGDPISGTAGDRTAGVTSLVHDFTVNRRDGSASIIQIDVSDIYRTARDGYTLGTFTPISVTPISSTSVQISPAARTRFVGNGAAYAPVTAYYGNGTKLAVTTALYNAGTQTAYTCQGSGLAVTKREGTNVGRGYPFYQMVVYNSSGRSLGSRWVSASATGGADTLYEAGTAYTHYDVGAGGAGRTLYWAGATPVTLQGTPTRAYQESATGTYQLKGDVVQGALVPNAEGDYILRGDSVTSHDVVTEGGIVMYGAGAETTYYEKTD